MRVKGMGAASRVVCRARVWGVVLLVAVRAASARGADSLVDVLRQKGVLTPEEHARLRSAEVPEAQRAALVDLLRAKGILTGEEAAMLGAERKEAPAQGGVPAAAKPPGAPQVGYEDGLFVRSEDGRFGLKLGGRVASNFSFFEPDTGGVNTATILSLEYDFAFASGLRDAYVVATPMPELNVQVGQFKVPFSYEGLLSKKYIDFVERAAVVTSTVSPSRDIGLMASGQLGGKLLQYQLAVMNGTGQNRSDNNGDKDVIGRLVLAPFAGRGPEHLRGLNFGGAVTYGRERKETITSSSGKTSLVANSIAGLTQTGFGFFSSLPRAGDRLRAGTHLAWLDGPCSVSGEYIHTEEERSGLGPGGADLPDIEADGAYVGGTWLLTGETKPVNARVRPARPLWDAGRPGWGAWEVALRYEFLDLGFADSPGGDGNGYDAAAAGLNWYPNEFLRLSVAYLYGHFDEVGKGKSLDPSKHSANAVLGRVQLEF
jgi:phosphate-selective porin OprO/OprP